MNIRNIVYSREAEKQVVWIGSSHADLCALPQEARRQLGYDLDRVQIGRVPRDWKPMGIVGHGVMEIRVRANGAFRLIYVAKFSDAIYVLHVFQKKTEKTSPLDLAVARIRFAIVRRAQVGE